MTPPVCLTPVCHVHTHTHTHWLKRWAPRQTQQKQVDFTKYTGSKVTVGPSAAVCTSRLTDKRTVRVQFPQVAPWSSPQVLPIPPAAHLILQNSLFKENLFWFQAALILDDSAATSRGCSIHKCQVLNVKSRHGNRCLQVRLLFFSLYVSLYRVLRVWVMKLKSPLQTSLQSCQWGAACCERETHKDVRTNKIGWIIRYLTFSGEPRC